MRYIIRNIRRSPGFATTAIVTFAFGIGATTTVFSLVNAVLLRTLPYRAPGRLVTVWKSVPRKQIDRDWASYPAISDWKGDSHAFKDLAFFIRPDGAQMILTGGSEPETIQGARVSENFFSVLGVPAAMGRTLGASDTGSVVVSSGFAKRHFGGANPLGRTVEIDHAVYRVIGVMPPDFQFPSAELWLLINDDPRWPAFQKTRIADAFGAIGRLQIPLDQAQAEMNILAGRLAREYPATDAQFGIEVVSLRSYLTGPRVPLILWIFMGAAILILLIACMNIAGVVLARGMARRKTFAIRSALGARRADILRASIAETTVLAMIAGLFGSAIAAFGIKALSVIAPVGIPGLDHAGLDATALAFTFVVSVAAGMLAGLGPAWRFSSADPQDSLRDRTSPPEYRRWHALLIASECALAVVLVAGTGLLLRTFLKLEQTDLGFRTAHLLIMRVLPQRNAQVFFAEAQRRIEAVPGVESAAVGDVFFAHLPDNTLTLEGRPEISNEPATWTFISEGFFRIMGIPLIRGRDFSADDRPDSTAVAIVNQTMARRMWPGEDPIGKRFKSGVPGEISAWLTVVGIAGDTVQNGAGTRPVNVFYKPLRQIGWSPPLDIVVRTTIDPAAVASAVRSEIRRADPEIPRFEIQTMDQKMRQMSAQQRFQAELLSTFSIFAMVLAAIGIYGMMAYSVARRSREIGVRVALGATRADVLWTVLSRSLGPACVGLIAGIALTMALARSARAFLYGIGPMDPATYSGVCALFLLIAVLAAIIPARRALSVDPLTAIRAE